MKKLLVLSCIASMSTLALADKHDHKHADKHGHDHESLGAHVHGTAQLAIALEDKNEVKFKLELPGDTAVGFEHKTKTAAERKKVKETEDLFRDKFSELIVVPVSFQCRFEKTDVEIDYTRAGHSHWDIEVSAKCAKPLVGETVEIKLGQHLPNLNELSIAIIGADFQKQVPLAKGTGSVKLSK